MSLDQTLVLAGLLQHNFLPTQKKTREELPPIFSSFTFTPDVARKINAGKLRNKKGYEGYDVVSYRLTRFNGVLRTCSIPHPAPYAGLALCIHDNWSDLDYITKNKVSLVRPMAHKDGRLMIMDYEEKVEETSRHLRSSFGRRLTVHTDIANYFPSVYSHAIPWAVKGFASAKKLKNDKSKWFNQLDTRVRHLSRNETQGVAIGPATSNVVSEAILARVDAEMMKRFVFVRFLDDYKAYCETESEAEEFVIRLAEELAKYKLMLNIGKTEILPLPQAPVPEWLTKLALVLPRGPQVDRYSAVSYLNLAVELAKGVPDGSVIKYAARAITRQNLEFMAKVDVLHYLLALAQYQPTLLPILEGLFDATMLFGIFVYASELRVLAFDNARFRRSDGMAWTLYYHNKYSVSVPQDVADQVLASRDCVALLMLYLSGDTGQQSSVLQFVQNLGTADLYELDQYWLLLYELFRRCAIPNPYKDEDAFAIMKAEAVSFVQLATP